MGRIGVSGQTSSPPGTFLQDTQPETAQALHLDQDNNTRRQFIQRLHRQISSRGIIDTLMTSMFGKAYNVDKREFTKGRLRDIQHAYNRFPAVFDDIGRAAIRNHGEDVIKDESPPLVAQYPCFVLSMNQELKAFTDQIVKRSLMVYTTTALPSYKESLRHDLHLKIQEVRRSLSTNLYREYLKRVLARLDETPKPEDWLEFSSSVLSGLIAYLLDEIPPQWCAAIKWNDYADKRHERVKAQIDHLLRAATRMKREGNQPTGWILEGDKVIVVEQTDTFGRREFDWENVPSTLIDDNASVGGRALISNSSASSIWSTPNLGSEPKPTYS